MTTFRSNAILLSCVLISACSNQMPDQEYICDYTPGIIKEYADNAIGQNKIVEQCIHKWAIRLGRAPGSNHEIADATIGRCRNSLNALIGMKVKESQADEPSTASDPKLIEARFREMALMRVVQGRAGNCPVKAEDQD